ncbi:MAG TPA: outer membrane beta-barrel protein [Gammaproteobacteria bacterium]|nr:outer membrane beta-barrel protein [Gammaproteobacteria bacterium]
MKKHIKKIFYGFLIFTFIGNVFAHVPIPRGWYADGSVGLTNTNTSEDDDGDNNSSTALGYNVNLGYKFLPFFGLEGGYTSYGTSSSSFTGNHAIDIALKGIIPFPEVGAEIYAKLGGAQVYPQGENNSTGLYYGFGADYWLFANMSILMQWMQAKGSDGPLNLFSIGVGFLI